MEIYTSNFAKMERLKKAGIVPVSIARYAPKGVSCFSVIELAPRAEMLKMPEAQYLQEYEKILNNLNPSRILNRIQTYAGSNNVALLCYEKSEAFCHRHLVAKWLNENLSLNVTEFEFQPKREIPAMGDLFDDK